MTKANVYECFYQQQRVILKDYQERNGWIRWTLGRWLAMREFKIYQKLKGIPGVSNVIEKIGPYSFLLEYLDGRPLAEMPQEEVPPCAFDSLKGILQKIHDRGIACADIHHRDVLITPSGKAFLIDFATGWQKGSKVPFLQNYIFKKLIALDWLSFYRMRERYTGIAPSPEEKKEFATVCFYHSLGRFLKRVLHFPGGDWRRRPH